MEESNTQFTENEVLDAQKKFLDDMQGLYEQFVKVLTPAHPLVGVAALDAILSAQLEIVKQNFGEDTYIQMQQVLLETILNKKTEPSVQ